MVEESNLLKLARFQTPPLGFFNISDRTVPGIYLVGNNKFFAKNVHILPIFQREFGGMDEVILAILSVFLISFASELVYAILLRRRKNNVSTALAISSASSVDALVHLRHLFQQFCFTTSRRETVDIYQEPSKQQRIMASAAVLVVAVLLFVAEVASVLLTQQTEGFSEKYQYNLRAVHPVGTHASMSRFILRDSKNTGCVTPVIREAEQTRHFAINACFKYEDIKSSDSSDSSRILSQNITVSSWYHMGGSDHEISSGEGIRKLSIRVRMFSSTEDGRARWLKFSNLDDEQKSHAKYLHDQAISAAAHWSCNQDFSTRTCSEIKEEIRIISSNLETREILLWETKKDPRTLNVTGIVTVFAVQMNSPFSSMGAGLAPLATSAAVLEVQDKGGYLLVSNEEEEDGVPGLLVENGRVAGIVLFAIIVVGLLILLVMTRLWLKPTSLSEFAMKAIQGIENPSIVDKDRTEKAVHEEEAREDMMSSSASDRTEGCSTAHLEAVPQRVLPGKLGKIDGES